MIISFLNAVVESPQVVHSKRLFFLFPVQLANRASLVMSIHGQTIANLKACTFFIPHLFYTNS